jgi:hypothetical protein
MIQTGGSFRAILSVVHFSHNTTLRAQETQLPAWKFFLTQIARGLAWLPAIPQSPVDTFPRLGEASMDHNGF